MSFTTPITFIGPARQPHQMLAEQNYDGHASVHDGETADTLGLSGAPIEGPTHFSQFDPLAFERWGQHWFATGCISAHFQNMVVQGDEVTAQLAALGETVARLDAAKPDGTPVLTGTASVEPHGETELDARRARAREPGELFILDQLSVGQRSRQPVTVSVDMDSPNGDLYPFSLRQKLDVITERTPWYDTDQNPWGRPILPIEMISVLAHRAPADLLVRGPSVGLFLDLEVRLHGLPLFVGQDYVLEREVVGLGQSRRTESYWVATTVTNSQTGVLAATVLLHTGVFKESYAKYPVDRL